MAQDVGDLRCSVALCRSQRGQGTPTASMRTRHTATMVLPARPPPYYPQVKRVCQSLEQASLGSDVVPHLTEVLWKAGFVAFGYPGWYHEKHEHFCPSCGNASFLPCWMELSMAHKSQLPWQVGTIWDGTELGGLLLGTLNPQHLHASPQWMGIE